MSVQSVGLGSSLPTSIPAGGRFFLPGAAEFADTLNIGQIIRGRVLRGFDGNGNRYLVAFGNDERVVDSTTPLTTGELLHGQVVGLGDRVELQRVYPRPAPQTARASNAPVTDPGAGKRQSADVEALGQLLQRYQVELSDSDRAVLTRAARGAADPQAMGLVGAMLSKLGLPQSATLLEAVYRAQLGLAAAGAGEPPDPVPQVTVPANPSVASQATSIRDLSELLARIVDSNAEGEPAAENSAQASVASEMPAGQAMVPSGATRRSQVGRPPVRVSGQGVRQQSLGWIADRVLNAQTGGVVTHRTGMLPLLVDGRLVEVSFAVFEQQRSQTQRPLQHRQLRFTLNTERLGRVDVLARIAGGHVRVQIATSDEALASQAAAHADSLGAQLREHGWTVDQIAHDTRAPDGLNAVVRSVIEHVVSQDSLDRLV